LKYRAEIDGLRALAVIPVIFFHAGFDLFSGGFVGVDVFFVISGYLITTILIDDIEAQRFTVLGFYERRARRLLPALTLVISCCIPVAWFVLNPFDLREFSQSILATSVFSSNFYFYLTSGYFDTAAELKPLLHTWSLAVEEQYYLVFPLFLLAVWRFGEKQVLGLIAALAVASLIASEWGWRNVPHANFYLAPTRAWEILAGSMTAFMVRKQGLSGSNFLSLLGLGAIVMAVFVYDEATPFPSVYALLPVIGVVLVVLYGGTGTIVARLLSNRVLVGVGLISYSAYLWHQPLFAFYRAYYLEQPDLGPSLAIILFTLVLAYLTWRFIEVPARKGKPSKYSQQYVLYLTAFALASLAILGLIGHIEQGFPYRNKDMLRLGQNFGLSSYCSGAPIEALECKSIDRPQIAVWGDSYAMHFVQGLRDAYPGKGVHQLTLSSCPPVPGYRGASRASTVSCHDYNELVARYLEDTGLSNDLQTVVLAASENLTSEILLSQFTANVQNLKELGYHVIVVTPTVEFAASEKCVTQAMRNDVQLSSCQFEFATATNKNVFEDLEKFTQEMEIDLIDLSAFMCRNGNCSLEKNGHLVVRDAGHLTNEIQAELSDFFVRNSLIENFVDE